VKEDERLGDELPSAPLARGARVGRYEILEPIGTGGMGRVYAARDQALGRKVALKLLNPASATKELEERLLREAKTMARLSHPEVVTVLDVGHHGDQLFVSMEFVEGATLRQWLAAAPRAWREILDVYLVAGRGLARAHAAGVAHRDFKPDNVLVASDGRVRVTDFGLARAKDTAPSERGVEGARSDVHAFCVALDEALRGSRRVPARVLRAVAVGLRLPPEERYPSMDAALAALEKCARPLRWPWAAAAAVVALAGAGIAAAERRPAPPAPGPAARAECARNRDCVSQHSGAPYACRASDHACVPIASEDCEPRFEPSDLMNDDTVWLGAMFPTHGAAADDFGTMNVEAADQARKEIARATRGAADAAGRVPQIALVVCDDVTDSARAAKHLADDVGVPAVFGFRSGQEVIELTASVLLPRGVLSVATLTASPQITRVPQAPDGPRMVWRTTYSFDGAGEAIARVISDVLEAGRPQGSTRIALMRDDLVGAASFAESFFRRLRFNGKTALENRDDYQEITLPPDAPAPAIEMAAKKLADATPTIVVAHGDYTRNERVFDRFEALLPRGATRPTYVLVLTSPRNYAHFMGTSADRRHRILSVDTAPNEANNTSFVARYNQIHATRVSRDFNGGVTYDAFYLLAYAVFASAERPAGGAAVASAFARLLPPGRPIDVGPSQVADALASLSGGGAIDLQGVASGLDFDLATGEEPSDYRVYCAGVDARGSPTPEDVPSGVTFDAKTGRVDGTLRCP
jgi:tRNA A-37 threonylcarbamoyl transferase component Bud32